MNLVLPPLTAARRAPAPRLLPLAWAICLACSAQTTPATSAPLGQEGNVTSVPAVDSGLGTSGGNLPVGLPGPANANAAANGNGVGDSAAAASHMTVAASTSVDLCLAAANSPAAVGTGVVLRPCAATANVRWWSMGGRLHTDNGLCLSNPSIQQDAAAAATAGQVQGVWVLPVLAACDANDVRQHVELFYGALVGQALSSTWGLAINGTATTTAQLVWTAYDGNAALQQWNMGADSHDANQVLKLDGFQISGTAAASPNLCMDTNARGGDGQPALSVQPCDANALTQRWRMTSWGALANGGRCLDANGTALTLPVCGAPVQSQKWQVNYGRFFGPTTSCLTPPAAATAGPVTLAQCANARFALGLY